MSILVQSIEVKNGVVNKNNNIPLQYIHPLFHSGNHTLTYVHKHVDGVPYFNKITFMCVLLTMNKIIAETTISLMEMTSSNVHFNKIAFTHVFLEMKKIIAETTFIIVEMTFSIVHVVISAPIWPIVVFVKAKHCSSFSLTLCVIHGFAEKRY